MDTRRDAIPSRVDRGPNRGTILVALNGRTSGWQALDWAAAEAAARQATLRILHVVEWPVVVVDPLSGVAVTTWPGTDALVDGSRILAEAVRRARLVTPDATITTHLEMGDVAVVVAAASRFDTLVVVGPGRRGRLRHQPTARRIARRCTAPLAVVQLGSTAPTGASAGQVVVWVDDEVGRTSALDDAFAAASRRGAGLTVLRACVPVTEAWSRRTCGSKRAGRTSVAIDMALRECAAAFPDVQIRQRFVTEDAGAALVAEARAAALVLVDLPRSRARRLVFSAVVRTAFRRLRGPVAMVPPRSGGREQHRDDGAACAPADAG